MPRQIAPSLSSFAKLEHIWSYVGLHGFPKRCVDTTPRMASLRPQTFSISNVILHSSRLNCPVSSRIILPVVQKSSQLSFRIPSRVRSCYRDFSTSQYRQTWTGTPRTMPLDKAEYVSNVWKDGLFSMIPSSYFL